MSKSVKKNFFYNLLYQMTIVLLPIVTIPYVSRVLLVEGIGIESLTRANTQYFILLGTVGITFYANKTIAQIRDNKYRVKKTFWEILLLQVLGCSISAIIFLFTMCLEGEYSKYYLIQGIAIISYAIDISWYFTGIEDFKKASLRSFFVKVSSVFLIFVFVKSANDLWKYILINVGTNLLGQIIMWFCIDKDVLRICDIKSMNFKVHILPILSLFIPQIAIQLYRVLDKTMLGILSNALEVGYYDQSQKIVRVLLSLVTALGTVMVPRVANLLANKKEEEAKLYLLKSFRFATFLSIPISFGLYGVSKNFVPIFFGDEFNSVIELLMISSIMIIIIGLGNVFGTQYLLAKGMNKEYTISVTIGAISNITLNLLLIPIMNSLGAVIATVSAELLIALIQGYYSRDIISKQWIKDTYKYWLSGFVMIAFVLLINSIHISYFFRLMIQIFSGIVIYSGMLFLLKDDLLLENLSKIVKKFLK